MPRAVLFSYVWPEPESSAAGVRTMAILTGLRGLNWEFNVFSPCAENPARARLENLGFKCQQVEANDSRVETLLQDASPEFVIFDRFVLEEQFGHLIRRISPHAVRVVDTQDLHFLRKSREDALKKNFPLEDIFKAQIPWEESAVLRECASIFRSDLTLLLSSFEISLLTERFKIPAQLLELAKISVPRAAELGPNFAERRDFVFIGNYRHPPNHDGVLWFTREIWPQVRERLGNAELHLYGAYPPREISALHNPGKGIRFFGPAVSAQTTLRSYRINLAPLRYGAGVKGKIADGWAVGTPAVSTPLGFEGMDEAGLTAKNSESFVDACVHLYTEEKLWNQHSQRGAEIFRQEFSPQENSLTLSRRLLDLKENLIKVREHNLIGRMLWREEARSTEYFSKWIEAKNKN